MRGACESCGAGTNKGNVLCCRCAPRKPGKPRQPRPGYIAPSRRGTCSRCGKTVQISRSSASEIVCHACRREEPQPWKLQEPKDACPTCGKPLLSKNSKIYCSIRCANTRPERARSLRACEICGESYIPSNSRSRSCSRTCGVKLKRRNGSIPPERAPSCPVYIKNCAQCGSIFVGRVTKAKFCSLRCRNKSRFPDVRLCACGKAIPYRRRKCDSCNREKKWRDRQSRKRRSITSEPYTLAEIALRDGYRCGLCHKRVAMTKAVPHRKAPTIDHIVPWSISKDDTRANVQLAHFICNSLIGAGGTKQLALIG